MIRKPPIAAELDAFYAISDVADALGVCAKTVDRWIKSGELVGHKVGRQWRISKTDLETFLKLRRGGLRPSAAMSSRVQ